MSYVNERRVFSTCVNPGLRNSSPTRNPFRYSSYTPSPVVIHRTDSTLFSLLTSVKNQLAPPGASSTPSGSGASAAEIHSEAAQSESGSASTLVPTVRKSASAQPVTARTMSAIGNLLTIIRLLHAKTVYNLS